MLMPSLWKESLFDELFDDFARPMRNAARYSASPSVMRTDVKESDTGDELNIELPGYRKENVKAGLKDG